MTMNMRIKRAGINLCLMILAFTIKLCIPVDAISDGNAESASDPDIFLWFY